MAAAVWYF